jgi:uncharacterized protein YqfA (UPF0365 family)
MAEAFRTGKMGIMEYYKLQNVSADTDMRKALSGTGRPTPVPGGEANRPS